jgi:hypothetical protein
MYTPPPERVLSPADLAKIGRTLYGEDWRKPLARALHVTNTRLDYLASGDRIIDPDLAAELIELVRARAVELVAFADGMDQRVTDRINETRHAR